MRQRLVVVPRALSGWLWLFQDLSDRLTTLVYARATSLPRP